MLKATHRLLRRLKPDWEMAFISDPTTWEQHLNPAEPPALILSDLLMPKLQGDALFRQVALRYPSTIRALITGDTSREVPELAGANVHFILPKPFTESDFAYVLDSVERLRDLPISAQARDRLAGLDALPVLPSRIRKIQQALRDPDADLSDIARMVSEEPALVTRLLQLANSAYLGFQKQTLSVEVAIHRLGTTVSAAVATCMLAQKVFNHVGSDDHQKVVDRCLKLAGLSRTLSQRLGRDKARQEEIYLAALMGALGELVLMEMGIEHALIDSLSSIEPGRLDALVIASYVLILWGYQLDIARLVLASGGGETPRTAPIDDGQLIQLCRQWLAQSQLAEQNQFCQRLDPSLANFFQAWPEQILSRGE